MIVDPSNPVGPDGAGGYRNVIGEQESSGQILATLLTGDGAIEGPNGTLIRPVVLSDVTTDIDIFASEIFGPATVIHPVHSTEAAIDMATTPSTG